MVDFAGEVWKEADSGIWEIRGDPRHYVYSKVMCWVALDRGIRIARSFNWPGDIERWQIMVEEIKQAVLEQGFNRDKNSFLQSFGSDALDASNLLLPFLGFLDFRHPRIEGTIDATLKELTEGPFVYRYRNKDNLPGEEGAFTLCTFWLIEALTLSGRLGQAREYFMEMMKYANHVGIRSEEIDPGTGKFLGNIPQGLTQIGFINSALFLGKVLGKRTMGPLLPTH
jgi:alpha,alpha-trehalase